MKAPTRFEGGELLQLLGLVLAGRWHVGGRSVRRDLAALDLCGGGADLPRRRRQTPLLLQRSR